MENKEKGNEPVNHEKHQLEANIQPGPETQNCAKSTQESERTKQSEKATNSFIRWSLCFEALLVIATCATVGVAYFQWQAMKSQSDIMKGQLDTTYAQTKAAFQQVSAAKSSIKIANDALQDARGSSKEQSDRAERLAKANEIIAQASKRSAEQSKASLEASTKQAQAALDASREAASLDQRAWVGLVGVETVGGEQTSDAFSFKSIIVAIRNSGKTPALQMSGECCMYVNRPWTDPIPDYDTETKRVEEERRKHDEERRKRNEEEIKRHPEMADRIREFEQSFSKATERKIPTGGVLAPSIVNNISVAPSMKFGRARKPGEPPQTLYVLGRFTYTDIFTGTQRHSTKFCLMHTGGDSFNICPESNWMD